MRVMARGTSACTGRACGYPLEKRRGERLPRRCECLHRRCECLPLELGPLEKKRWLPAVRRRHWRHPVGRAARTSPSRAPTRAQTRVAGAVGCKALRSRLEAQAAQRPATCPVRWLRVVWPVMDWSVPPRASQREGQRQSPAIGRRWKHSCAWAPPPPPRRMQTPPLF